MNEYLLTNARIVLPDRVIRGTVRVKDRRIADITEDAAPAPHSECDEERGPAETIDLKGNYLCPGFVELHSHGAGGADYMDGTEEAYITAAGSCLKHGVTSILPTLLAASDAALRCSLSCFANVRETMNALGVYAPGVHLEGPYINVSQRGAIPQKYIRDPDPGEYEALFRDFGQYIRRVTIAPELDGALQMGDFCANNGVLVSMGHSEAVYEEVRLAVKHGFRMVTHLFSAMSTITRAGGFRRSGLLESAFCLPELAVEIIADGCHIPPELLEFTVRSKGAEHTALITDSMRAAGTDAARSVLGSGEASVPVLIEDGVAKLEDRSAFAGSVATADRLLRVMVNQAGIPVTDAVRMMTLTPAELAGIDDLKGSISAGKDADLVILDDSYAVKGVIARGKRVSGIFA